MTFKINPVLDRILGRLDLLAVNIDAKDKKIRHKTMDFFAVLLPMLKDTLIPFEYNKKHPDFYCAYEDVKNFMNSHTFQYRIVNEPGRICSYGIPNCKDLGNFQNEGRPAYIATMLHNARTGSTDYLEDQIFLLRREGFCKTDAESLAESEHRLGFVIGVNYCKKLLTEENQAKQAYVKEVKKLGTDKIRIADFKWAPRWVRADNYYISLRLVRNIFQILRRIDEPAALKLNNRVWTEFKIPFQRLRECTAFGLSTALIASKFKGPVSIFNCDDDLVRARQPGKKGLFDHYDKAIKAHPNALLFTTGYIMRTPGEPYVEIATRLELSHRRAIGLINPAGTYFPEPGFVLRLMDKNRSLNVVRHSFITDGSDMESRRLIENMGLMNVEAKDKMIFWHTGEIETSRPARFKITPGLLSKIRAKQWTNSAVLDSFRSVCQNSISPLSFAKSFTKPLPPAARTNPYKSLVAQLFKCFDPIEYAKPGHLSDWKNVFIPFIKKLNSLRQARSNNPRLPIDYIGEIKNIYEGNISYECNLSNGTECLRKKLTELEVIIENMKTLHKDSIGIIYRASFKSGLARYRTIIQATRVFR